MKYINNSINKKFSQGFNNILSPSLINLFIALSLLIIIALIYLKYNKIELYIDNYSVTADYINQMNLNNNTGYMSSIIDNYIKSKKDNNKFKEILNDRQKNIQDISYKINELIA
jgi:hypothetical protein